MVGLFVFFGFIGLVLLLLWINKVYIDWRSIFAPTMYLDRGIFGVYCFEGKQGSGKTYSLTKFLKREGKGIRIFSNINLIGIKHTRLTSLQQLLDLRKESGVFIVYDELLNLLNDKSIPRDIRDDLFEFLSQQRKVKNILFTTTQEWLNIPIEFRRFVRIQIKCSTRPLGRFGGILREEYRDGYGIVWSNIENEYVAPRIALKYSKYERSVMKSYDTFEKVKKLDRHG